MHFRPDFRKLRRENFHKEEKSSKILKSKTQLVKLSKKDNYLGPKWMRLSWKLLGSEKILLKKSFP